MQIYVGMKLKIKKDPCWLAGKTPAGRGEEYAAHLLASHEEHLAEEGYDFITHHDSITGRVVSFYGGQK